jgi:thioester reductase-like protein/acyl carrier protein
MEARANLYQIQGVPRRVLSVILSIESGSKKQQAAPKKQAAPAAAAKAAAPAPASSEPHTGKLTQALNIIAEESGLAIEDLTDGTNFADAGIDSLLGLTISARFKEEIGVDIDFNELFFECPTVADLKTFLGEGESWAGSSSASSAGDDISSPESGGTGITTPETGADDLSSKETFHSALEIISEESGVAMEDLTDDTDFAEAGVDSLLSLVISSRFRDELGLDMGHESFFMDCPTVADLRQTIIGDSTASNTPPLPPPPPAESSPASAPAPELAKKETPQHTESAMAELAARKKAVDEYVERYIAGFSVPAASSSGKAPSGKVVLVTGASGSLGGQLVDQLAHMDDIEQVVCLNREKANSEPYDRQQKAMREKGIRSFDKIRPKLLVLQTDSAKPKFGLSDTEYEGLVNSVTHLIHNAWPMSAKRALPGFESQFQVMRNLLDLASDVVGRRPESFNFSFEMVSSIGVVGHYGLGNGEPKTMVPEDRMSIDTVLPNGYGDAKWGCERMIDETLHKHPGRFRAMATRLGQIAGSKDHGYWNPMEHFGFLVKSSQTLNALPDTGGMVYWTSVNDVAGSLIDLVLADNKPHPLYHIENPVGQTWSEMNTILQDACMIDNLIPFEEWVERVRKAPTKNNPASTLLGFLDDNYLRMSCGGLVLDTKNTLEHSQTLRALGPIEDNVVRKYIHIWKEIGFLSRGKTNAVFG